jgi:peptidyl-tRNA hydrolase
MKPPKLYVVVRSDLPPGDQAVQAVHAAINFCQENADVADRWFDCSNHLALLQVRNENELKDLTSKARFNGFRISEFREPDLGESLTAIAIEPEARRICSNLKLAFS